MMNFSANMLGLDNAATPLGLKAMKELQEINPDKMELKGKEPTIKAYTNCNTPVSITYSRYASMILIRLGVFRQYESHTVEHIAFVVCQPNQDNSLFALSVSALWICDLVE